MIKLSELVSGYGDTPILKGLSLTIAKGDFCALLGPNGAGKSTLLYTLIGYLKPESGQVLLDGRDIATSKRSWIARQLAFVPQESLHEFDHTVYETILMGRYPYLNLFQSHNAEDYAMADRILARLNLEGLKDRWYSELSGGEKQRVLIARALVQDTPCLILDESLSQLDINHQIEIMALLRDIHRKEGKTILVVSHNLNLAANYAETLIFLKAGQLLAKGKATELMQPATLHELFGLYLETSINPNSKRPNIVYP